MIFEPENDAIADVGDFLVTYSSSTWLFTLKCGKEFRKRREDNAVSFPINIGWGEELCRAPFEPVFCFFSENSSGVTEWHGRGILKGFCQYFIVDGTKVQSGNTISFSNVKENDAVAFTEVQLIEIIFTILKFLFFSRNIEAIYFALNRKVVE